MLLASWPLTSMGRRRRTSDAMKAETPAPLLHAEERERRLGHGRVQGIRQRPLSQRSFGCNMRTTSLGAAILVQPGGTSKDEVNRTQRAPWLRQRQRRDTLSRTTPQAGAQPAGDRASSRRLSGMEATKLRSSAPCGHTAAEEHRVAGGDRREQGASVCVLRRPRRAEEVPRRTSHAHSAHSGAPA